jgi:hypothetical protein
METAVPPAPPFVISPSQQSASWAEKNNRGSRRERHDSLFDLAFVKVASVGGLAASRFSPAKPNLALA